MTTTETPCGGCGHPGHWRECRGTTIGVISGQPTVCECRRRGPQGPSTDDFGFEVHDPLHGIDSGPCADFAPDTLGDDPRVCTTCFYSGSDHLATATRQRLADDVRRRESGWPNAGYRK